MIKSGKRVVITAHGNSLRALGELAKEIYIITLSKETYFLNLSYKAYVHFWLPQYLIYWLRIFAVKFLDNIPEDQIAELNIPTGVPLVYSLDENMKPIPHADAIFPLQVLLKPKCTSKLM